MNIPFLFCPICEASAIILILKNISPLNINVFTIVYIIHYNELEVMTMGDNLSNLIIELRRGTLTLAVLSQLREPQYGYSLLQRLEELNTLIEAGTLYPLLRRLESQGLLESHWNTEESRPRKYYVLSPDGLEIYQTLKSEWERLNHDLSRLLKEE